VPAIHFHGVAKEKNSRLRSQKKIGEKSNSWGKSLQRSAGMFVPEGFIFCPGKERDKNGQNDPRRVQEKALMALREDKESTLIKVMSGKSLDRFKKEGIRAKNNRLKIGKKRGIFLHARIR